MRKPTPEQIIFIGLPLLIEVAAVTLFIARGLM